MLEKVAVIGMGQMGSGMAGRLKESGLDVIGYDVGADQRARLTRDGFQMASGIAEALAGRTLVLTSLPDPKAVTAAWLGADGIVAHAARGTLCIELSTIDPQTMRQVAEAATSSGLAVVDCPVSGSPNEARSGKLILIAGGEMADVTRAEPIRDSVAAISCGIYRGTPVLDLDYLEDVEAETDANFVLTGDGRFVEIQGTAEQTPFTREELSTLMGLAEKGIGELTALQKQTLNG